MVKLFFTAIFLFATVFTRAQDKIVLTDGSAVQGRVTEVTPDEIVLRSAEGESRLPVTRVLLIEYKNGAVETYTTAGQDADYPTRPNAGKDATGNTIQPANFVSLNTLALVNADVAVFYERVLYQRKLTAGLMAAANFNMRATGYNLFIGVLNNGKKTHDLGAFLNYYPTGMSGKTRLYFGLMMKYTGFRYSVLKEDTLVNGGTSSIHATYTPATGSQLATIVTFGSQTKLGESFFVKTIFGIGGFAVKGTYREQLTLMFERTRGDGPSIFTGSSLPKLYLGFNAGFSF
jgi:hypothetical protein